MSPILEQISYTKIATPYIQSTNHSRETVILLCENYLYVLKNRALDYELKLFLILNQIKACKHRYLCNISLLYSLLSITFQLKGIFISIL